ncbi:hypothetical protein GOP47_0022789 [Adiantum capillus-veneris]|uniref:Uncharacterized protein n=1 Tax=Adiantum capillus-veneris TaxID=13818 RepID=A0A9D4U6Y3_ADICA|nr:hypothetical protein GOP47_0022789 [Adiantum capillus-veneris]
MAAAIAQATSKRLASLAVSSTPKRMPGVKQLHSSAPKQTGGSHDSHVVAIGTGVPIFAVIFQQKKAMIM